MTDEKKTPSVKTALIPQDGQDDIELARIAQARLRDQAPETMIAESLQIPQKKLISQFCPEAVGPNATHHAWFGDSVQYKQNLHDGNEPVYDRGQKILYGGDPMLKIPIDIHKKRMQASADRGNKILSKDWVKDAKAEKASHLTRKEK